MKQIIYQGRMYDDAVIVDDSICLQSLHQDVHFDKGYSIVKAKLMDEWYKLGAPATFRDYVNEYENQAILEFIQETEGNVIQHDLN